MSPVRGAYRVAIEWPAVNRDPDAALMRRLRLAAPAAGVGSTVRLLPPSRFARRWGRRFDPPTPRPVTDELRLTTPRCRPPQTPRRPCRPTATAATTRCCSCRCCRALGHERFACCWTRLATPPRRSKPTRCGSNRCRGLVIKIVRAIANADDHVCVDSLYQWCRDHRVRAMFSHQEHYPASLHDLDDPPPVLFIAVKSAPPIR